MAAPMVKTQYPGIYKRGSRYVVKYRADGRQHSKSAATLKEALRIKRERESARDRGEHDLYTEARTPFRDFASEWVERYHGNGRRGFTDDTRAEYRRDLARYAFPFFGERTLASVRPRDVSTWIAWLCDEKAQGERQAEERKQRGVEVGAPEPVALSDATIKRIVVPARACFATAVLEGLIRVNPCDKVPLPNRPRIEDEDEEDRAKALTREQLAMFLRIVRPQWRLLFEFDAVTGLRFSELAGLRWRDLYLDGSDPYVRVRRVLARRPRKGEDPRFKPPKSGNGKRSIPLGTWLADALKERRWNSKFNGPDDLVFCNDAGGVLDHSNLLKRVARPALGEAGASWAAIHTFRHTCASMLFSRGRNIVQVCKWLGHADPAFTLRTYVHLLDDGVGQGLDLGAELAGVGTEVGTSGAEIDQAQPRSDPSLSALALG